MVMAEPVANWTNVRGNDLLRLSYNNAEKHCSTLQHLILLDMFKNHKEVSTLFKANILERSVHSSIHVFAKYLNTLGHISDLEHEVLLKYYNWMANQIGLDCNVDLIIYLKASPEICHMRLQKRGRSAEQNVGLDFLRGLERDLESWLHKQNLAPVITIDSSMELADCRVTYSKIHDCLVNLRDPQKICAQF